MSGQPLQLSRKLPGIGERERLVRWAKLSAALLVGLGANALFGLWWADPVTALLIAGVALKEGRESWSGESCCTAPVVPGENCEDECCR